LRAGDLREELVVGLALEIRRSLDYFESQYERNPVVNLYAYGLTRGDQQRLAADLPVTVSELRRDAAMDSDVELTDESLRLCLPAIGADPRHASVRL
jgi:hypothetical protein